MDFEPPVSDTQGMTLQMCLDACKQFGYIYAGAQNGNHWYDQTIL
jgi:hypothetical protein